MDHHSARAAPNTIISSSTGNVQFVSDSGLRTCTIAGALLAAESPQLVCDPVEGLITLRHIQSLGAVPARHVPAVVVAVEPAARELGQRFVRRVMKWRVAQQYPRSRYQFLFQRHPGEGGRDV